MWCLVQLYCICPVRLVVYILLSREKALVILYPLLEGVTVLPGVVVSSANVNENDKVTVKLSNGDEVSAMVCC